MAEIWRWPLTSIKCRYVIGVELYFHAPTRLLAVVSTCRIALTFSVSGETLLSTTCFVIFIWPWAPFVPVANFIGIVTHLYCIDVRKAVSCMFVHMGKKCTPAIGSSTLPRCVLRTCAWNTFFYQFFAAYTKGGRVCPHVSAFPYRLWISMVFCIWCSIRLDESILKCTE
jgi:hypothetical protein